MSPQPAKDDPGQTDVLSMFYTPTRAIGKEPLNKPPHRGESGGAETTPGQPRPEALRAVNCSIFVLDVRPTPATTYGVAAGLAAILERPDMTARAPALFVGHGSPMNAIEDTPSARGWAEIAQRFAKPRAIVAISAHWVTDGVRVMSNAQPKTIHDFGRGFPQALFDVRYPAPGDPALAREIVEKLSAFGARLDDGWGLDHGAWSVLRRMYPEADAPVVQVSLDARRPPQEHYEIARALGPLRDDGVLILAAGNIVHNLAAFFRTKQLEPWVERFDRFVADAAASGDDGAVLRYGAHPDAREAAPDWEHFFPVFYALGARRDGESAYLFNQHYEPGLSMTAFAYGLAQ